MKTFAKVLSISAAALLFSGAVALAESSAAMKALDPDNDGTIDLDEAYAGAKTVWDSINNDGDETLEAGELEGMVDAKGLDMADPDDDDSLDWNEYKALVKQKFEAANPDDDGTLDQKELDSPAGQEFLKLVYKS